MFAVTAHVQWRHLNSMMSSPCWEMIISSIFKGIAWHGEFRLSEKDSCEMEIAETLQKVIHNVYVVL